MFLINSRLGLFTAASQREAPLLPKLRGQYAEFLNNPSPDGLRILSSSTCVGLWYGYLTAFSRHRYAHFPNKFQSLSTGATSARLELYRCVSIVVRLATECLPYVHRLRLAASP